MEETFARPYVRARPRLSWGGVVAGTICTLAMFDLLLVLGSAIGLTAFNPARADWRDLQGAIMAGGIWVAAAAAASTFLGTLVGVRLSAVPTRGVAALQGLVTWALAWQLVVTTLMIASAVGALQMPEVAAVAQGQTPGTGVIAPQDVRPGDITEAGAWASWGLFGATTLSAIAAVLAGFAAWPDTHRQRAISRPARSVRVDHAYPADRPYVPDLRGPADVTP